MQDVPDTLATGAAWIVPQKYIEQVGDEAFKQRPVGLEPYKFVSQTAGIEIVLEANETYWRKVPHVKRLVFKSVPEPTTRMAMIKKGAETLGASKPTGSMVPRAFEFALPFEPYPYDPAKAKFEATRVSVV
jgi:ABC-type oligopeptide transport system substrate-binding subunit